MERRQHARISCAAELYIHQPVLRLGDAPCVTLGRIRNLSTGGLLCETSGLVPIWPPARIVIDLEDGRGPFWVQGRLCRCLPFQDGFLVGVQFDEHCSIALEQIAGFVAAQATSKEASGA